MPYDGAFFVSRTRQLVQVFGAASSFVDGFTPAGEGETSVLDAVNDVIADLSLCRIRTVRKSTAAVVGQHFYTLPADVIEFISCKQTGAVECSITSFEGLRDDKPYWENTTKYPNGTPERAGRLGQEFFVWPAPATTANLLYRVSSIIPPITTDVGTLDYIPDNLQRKIPYAAALILATVDSENSAQRNRQEEYKAHGYSLFKSCWMLNTHDYASPADFDKLFPLPAYLSRSTAPYKPVAEEK